MNNIPIEIRADLINEWLAAESITLGVKATTALFFMCVGVFCVVLFSVLVRKKLQEYIPVIPWLCAIGGLFMFVSYAGSYVMVKYNPSAYVSTHTVEIEMYFESLNKSKLPMILATNNNSKIN